MVLDVFPRFDNNVGVFLLGEIDVVMAGGEMLASILHSRHVLLRFRLCLYSIDPHQARKWRVFRTLAAFLWLIDCPCGMRPSCQRPPNYRMMTTEVRRVDPC